MPFAIGLRFYRITVRKKGEKDILPVGPGSEPCDLNDYMNDFVAKRTNATVETSEPRTWFFERKDTNSIRATHGYLNYGTHGFESKLKDVNTRQEKYNRQASDLEEIPLYFQIWTPSDSKFAIIAFQSFQGRSCVSFVRAAMVRDFQERFPSYIMSFQVLVPAASLLDTAPVKTITFIKPRKSSDRADRMLGKPMDEVDYELTVRAKKRGGVLATYSELRKLMSQSSDGFVEFDGHEFEGAKADVKMGRKRRTVGVFGSGIDAGLIDISENVKRAKSGHPVFESIMSEVDDLMEELYGNLKT